MYDEYGNEILTLGDKLRIVLGLIFIFSLIVGIGISSIWQYI